MLQQQSPFPPAELEDLLERLPSAIASALSMVRREAAALEQPVYLVGGAVRDLLLGRSARDLDLVVEGDALDWARRLAPRIGSRLTEHPEFLTATLELPSGLLVDAVSTRKETYARPAALPTVEPGDLESDLRRRDFTVNTMAIRLWPLPAPVLIDPFGGWPDLSRGVLRILHARSFFDDPTRLPRAVELELRLGLRLDSASVEAWEHARASGVVSALSGARLRAAMERILAQRDLLEGGVRRLSELGFLHEILPDLVATEMTLRRLAEASTHLPRECWGNLAVEELAWLLLTLDLAPSARRHLATRLHFQGRHADRFVEAPSRVRAAIQGLCREDLAAHEMADALAGLTPEERAVCWVLSEPGRPWIDRFEREWKAFRLSISGADLLRLGVAPGRSVGRALRGVRAARIDGKITADQELGLALQLARQDRIDP